MTASSQLTISFQSMNLLSVNRTPASDDSSAGLSANQLIVFFSLDQISTSHQLPTSQQYFSLTTNQQQQQAAKQSPNKDIATPTSKLPVQTNKFYVNLA